MSKDEKSAIGVKRAVTKKVATAKDGRFSAPCKAEAVLRLLRSETKLPVESF